MKSGLIEFYTKNVTKIYDGKIQYSKSIGKMDYRMLMNKESNFTINEVPIIEAYNYYTSRWYFMYHTDDNYVDDEYIWAFKNIRDELLKLGEKDFVINTLIAYCYTVKKYSNKKLLWACFGKEITENLERNLKEDNRKICPSHKEICSSSTFLDNTSLLVSGFISGV